MFSWYPSQVPTLGVDFTLPCQVSAAARRGARHWAEEYNKETARARDQTRYPRIGAFEVWALVPGHPPAKSMSLKYRRDIGGFEVWALVSVP